MTGYLEEAHRLIDNIFRKDEEIIRFSEDEAKFSFVINALLQLSTETIVHLQDGHSPLPKGISSTRGTWFATARHVKRQLSPYFVGGELP